MSEIHIRLATLEDARMVFEWRNTPFITARGSSQRPVEWEEHFAWFRETLLSTRRLMFIVMKEDLAIGQARFDRVDERVCVISLYLLEPYTGKGYGLEAMRKACRTIFDAWSVMKVVACVRSDNATAQSAFRKAGFVADAEARACPDKHVTLSFMRDETPVLWKQDDEDNVRLYTGLLERHGIDARSLDWGSRESQEARFRVLSGVSGLHGASVLDVGCGLGDFYGWLTEARLAVKYTGLDITPAMINAARSRFPAANFLVGNLLGASVHFDSRFDYVFASGIFAHRTKAPFQFLKATVTAMFDLCDIGIGFNSLSDWALSMTDEEFHASPVETLEFCRTLTPWVSLRHDYHPRDFAIHLFKERSA